MPVAKEQELLSMFELNKADDSTLRIRVHDQVGLLLSKKDRPLY